MLLLSYILVLSYFLKTAKDIIILYGQSSFRFTHIYVILFARHSFLQHRSSSICENVLPLEEHPLEFPLVRIC